MTTPLQGKHPLAVVATSGTTVVGAFDPLKEIADICERHEIWLHIDVSDVFQREMVMELDTYTTHWYPGLLACSHQ